MIDQRTPLEQFLGKAILIGLGIAFLDGILNPGDTVNYVLKRKKRIVYHGVTYEDRIDKRYDEHEAYGKKFDELVYDYAKPRHRALKLEKKLIGRDLPIYNIQHNR